MIEVSIVIPNQEINNIIKEKVISYYLNKTSVDYNKLTNASKKLDEIVESKSIKETHKAFENFTIAFQEFLESLPSFKKNNTRNAIVEKEDSFHFNENLIHNLMNMVIICSTPHQFSTELELDHKRPDITFIDKKHKKCFVIEIKINQTADDAYNQIDKKEYQDYFENLKLNYNYKIIKIGVNVTEKNVSMKYECV